MDQAVGEICTGCKETLYGIGWVEGELVVFSNCTCNGHDKPSYRILSDALKDLGPDRKGRKIVEEDGKLHVFIEV